MITAISGVIASSISSIPPFDPDAQAFFNAEIAAGVTLTTTQKDAVNQWVVDAKAAGIWTKFKAIYPMVGGTATAHKFNLKNPADTNAAFRLQFFGGGTHSANGYLPNGVDAFADTFFIPSINGTLNSSHVSFYSRTNVDQNSIDIGANNALGTAGATMLYTRVSNFLYGVIDYFPPSGADYISGAVTDSRGHFLLSRTASNLSKAYKNGSVLGTKASVGNRSSLKIAISALNKDNPNQQSLYSTRQCAFSTIGDGLLDLEAQLFYQITEKYQVALGRNVNPTQSFYYNSAYNNETNAFLFSTQITDATIQTATNTLVSDLKTANIWTKMKAVYPMVGGTATTHKFNLVNAQDTDAAFRLSFVGGVTHSANGIQGNGTNGYANTFLNMQTVFPSGNSSIGAYNRTNVAGYMLGARAGTGNTGNPATNFNHSIIQVSSIIISPPQAPIIVANRSGTGTAGLFQVTPTPTSQLGLLACSRVSSTLIYAITNSGLFTNTTNVTQTVLPNLQIALLALNTGTVGTFSTHQLSFAYIADSLTSTELTALRTINLTFQTTLGRNV